jgi:hypothetical protein
MKISNVFIFSVCLFLAAVDCEGTTCGEDEYVVSHTCVPCPSGQSNMAGDEPSGQDTICDTCKITTNQELREHVDQWIADPSVILAVK